jgi:hypothetical protein
VEESLEPSPVVMELPAPIVEIQPPPEPPDEVEEAHLPPEAEAEAEPAAEPAPEPWHQVAAEVADDVAPVQESAPEEPLTVESEPELVVTETMAEIFLRQGHRELALAVYAQLAQRDPSNDRVTAALSALQAELAPPAAPAPEPEPAPRFAAADTGGRSVHELFHALLSASRPPPAATVHPPAFEAPRRPMGEPTRPAQETLSLSAVFGDEAAPSRPAGTQPSPATGEPSFDEFYTPGGSAEAELPRAPGAESATAPSQVPEDLEQFNAWLRGLKR